MQPDLHHWRELSALLEALLALPAEEREAWIAALPADKAAHAPELRRMLDAALVLDRDEVILARPSISEPTLAGVNAEHEATAQAGAEFGPYRLLRPIGRGGMGVVWLAERSDGLLQRSVAIKLPVLTEGASRLVARFARERSILGALNHPNIARLYDAGVSAEGQPFLVMEYVPGVSIVEYCDRARLSVEARLRLFLQVLAAVQHAHGLLIVHRDIKPSNILVTPEGEVRLVDFGIAKLIGEHEFASSDLTQLTGRALTQHYASPEQVQDDAVSIGSDVYSLGVVLYQLLTGRRPYALKSESRADLEAAIVSMEPQRPGACRFTGDEAQARRTAPRALGKALKGDLEAILLKALRKLPAERYLTAQSFADDIERHLRHEVVTAQPITWHYRAGKFLIRYTLATALAAVAAVSLLVGSAVALWAAKLASDERAAAQAQAQLARQEAERANAFRHFMVDILHAGTGNADTAIAQRKRTAQEILTSAVERLKSEKTMDLSAKAAVYAALGDIFDVFLLVDASRDAHRAAVAAMHAKPGGPTVDDVPALAQAGLAEALQDEKRGTRLLQEAQALLTAAGGEGNTEAHFSLANAQSNVATEALGDPVTALAHNARAVAITRANPKIDPVSATFVFKDTVENLYYLGRFDEAIALSRDALKRYETMNDVESARFAFAVIGAEITREQGHLGQAERDLAQAKAEAVVVGGSEFPNTLMLQAKAARFRATFFGERTSVAQFPVLVARMRAALGHDDHFFVPGVLRTQGAAQIALGDAATGVATLRAAATMMPPGNPHGLSWIIYALDIVPGLIALGNLDEAERWLQQIAPAVATTQGVYGWQYAQQRVALALARGDAAGANEALRRAGTVAPSPPTGSPAAHELALLGAQVALANGDAALAEQRAQALRTALAAHRDRAALTLVDARAALVEGAAQLQVGKSANAIATLKAALNTLTRLQHPRSTSLAQAQKLLTAARGKAATAPAATGGSHK